MRKAFLLLPSLRRVLFTGWLAAVCTASPLCAALVVFEDGRLLHADSFDVDGDRVSISLKGGGKMTIDLDRVEQIVDDEVTPPAPVEPAAPVKPAAPRRSVRAKGTLSADRCRGYGTHILAAAEKFHLDPGLLASVIRAESDFNPRARSRKGARGLMQLMPAAARRFGVRERYDPRQNIFGGAAYLSALADRFGETASERIIAAYNAGEHTVDRYDGVPPFKETQDYVKRVTAFWGEASPAQAPNDPEHAAPAAGAAP